MKFANGTMVKTDGSVKMKMVNHDAERWRLHVDEWKNYAHAHEEKDGRFKNVVFFATSSLIQRSLLPFIRRQ